MKQSQTKKIDPMGFTKNASKANSMLISHLLPGHKMRVSRNFNQNESTASSSALHIANKCNFVA